MITVYTNYEVIYFTKGRKLLNGYYTTSFAFLSYIPLAQLFLPSLVSKYRYQLNYLY